MTTVGHSWHGTASAPRHLLRTPPARRQRTVSAGVAARGALFAAATLVAVSVVSPAAAPADASATAGTRAARTAAVAESARAVLVERAGALEAELADAAAAHEAADGRVLDDAVRVALTSEIELAHQALVDARSLLVWPEESLRAGLTEAALLLVEEGEAALVAAQEELATAVAAWEAEQARIAAEEAARAAAAAAAAAPHARWVGASRGAAPASVAGGVAHVEGIWTSGGQGQIDACRGSVNVPQIAGYLGGAFYAAEHWGCGGSAWGRIGAGSLVEFSGYGTYRVAGVVSGLVYGADASAIPRGYAGYYQTCIGGSGSNMAVWLLERA
ncbi:hypothetical protein H4J02_07895 [Protaetiibacter sp. SSC-01]|uniref:hypothetical protein n=1 Tax=Protaetiibacter sp. SSC-01 TaxID=2759943 RepID=UPI0016569FFB|nr:hypothetical protein [Protaetiibacter sp. SSC-01]QNO36457.1 hypothetical protein H4J02_07895 [Protaetiibacter sp. SSC-01]